MISVVLPVFNDQAGIDKVLDRLCRQEFEPGEMEVVVVDNGSSPPIAVRQGLPFPVVLTTCPIPGSYAARNHGVQRASGDVVAFLDADCIPRRDWLRRGLEAIRKYEYGSPVGGEVHTLLPANANAVEKYQWIVGFGQKRNIEERLFSVTANLFCPRWLFEKVGPFDDALLSGGDLEWSWRAASAGHPVRYAADAVVETRPRSSLAKAVIQARRVAGGRAALRKKGGGIPEERLSPHRGVWDGVAWILSHRELTLLERFRVLAVATLIRCASVFERVRLSLGGEAERR